MSYEHCALGEDLRVEETKFDTLLRKATQQTTRRASLGVLLGGAVLLTSRGEIEATKEAERRRRRYRRQRRRQGPDPFPRRPSVELRVKRTLNVSIGLANPTPFFSCCTYVSDQSIGPDDRVSIGADQFGSAWLLVDDGKYWFEFFNPTFGKPYVEIAFNGRYRPSANCCRVIPYGQTVERRFTLGKRQSRVVNIAGQPFRIAWVDETAFVIVFVVEML